MRQPVRTVTGDDEYQQRERVAQVGVRHHGVEGVAARNEDAPHRRSASWRFSSGGVGSAAPTRGREHVIVRPPRLIRASGRVGHDVEMAVRMVRGAAGCRDAGAHQTTIRSLANLASAPDGVITSATDTARTSAPAVILR